MKVKMNTPYKIVYCTPALYSAGGVERVISVKASYFAETYGYDVTVIITEGQNRQTFFPVSDKVKIVNLGIGFEELWRASFLKKIFIYLQKQRKYKQLLTAELLHIRPDITISVLRREINFINTIKDGSLKIGELHVNRSNYRNFTAKDSNIVKRLFAKYWTKSLVGHLQQLDRMVVLTESARSDWPELERVSLIPDPLPFHVTVPSSLTAKRVISIGRYAYEKGNDLLLKAWAKVEKECPDWTLDIYGMGDRQPYRDMMQRLGIDESRCRLHGSLTDVSSEYLKSSIFALPSRFEGFGLVIIEAMACGLPVVSFDCENGPRNILTNGKNGFLVPCFDTDAYARQLESLMTDDSLLRQVGREAREASAAYSLADVARQWQQLFDKLMTGK